MVATSWVIGTIIGLLASVVPLPSLFRSLQAVGIPIKPQQPTLLLVGPTRSGKTSLFQRVLHGASNDVTYTSQKANKGQLLLDNGRKIQVVDTPGHPKLFQEFRDHVPTNIAFVLDSSTLSKDVAAVARNLLEVLTFARSCKAKEVCILANKSDFFTALPVETVTTLLETEIEQIRQRKDGVQMDSIEEKQETDQDWLYDLPGHFRLADECEVIAGTVLKDDLGKWQDWLLSAFA